MKKKVVVIGAHPDDYEIGAAMRLMYHVIRDDDVVGIICTDGERAGDPKTRLAEAQSAADLIGIKRMHFLHYPDTRLHEKLGDLRDELDSIVTEENPSVAYLISPYDRHQDHRAANEASMVACRDVNNILFYKTPSTNFTEFQPHLFHMGSIEDYLKKEEVIKRHKSQIETGRINMDHLALESRNYCYCAGNPKIPKSGYAEPFGANHVILNFMDD